MRLNEKKAEDFGKELLDKNIIILAGGGADEGVFSNERYYVVVSYNNTWPHFHALLITSRDGVCFSRRGNKSL